jgi:histidinol-phosphate phosphatase family protein
MMNKRFRAKIMNNELYVHYFKQMSIKAVFLDRDGTINMGVPTYERVDSVDKVKLLPNVVEALKLLATLDYKVFFITNQAGVAEGLITLEQFNEINNKVLEYVAPSGIKIEKTYLCPHAESDNCECRKPKPKLLLDAAKEYDIDLSKSWMLGDRSPDVMTGVNAGTKTILVKSGVQTVESEHATFTAPTLLEAIQYIAQHNE